MVVTSEALDYDFISVFDFIFFLSFSFLCRALD